MPYREMLAALRLTRAGDLVEATALLQRALGGVTAAHASRSGTSADRRSATAPRHNTVLRPIDSAERAQAVEQVGRADSLSRSSGANGSSQSLQEELLHEESRGRLLSLSFRNAAGLRNYKLYIPSGYDGRPCPLIVMLHGCTQSPDDFAAGTRMNVLADERTCLVAYPEQPASANPSKCWNWFNRRNQHRDRGEPSLVAGITRQIMHDYVVDRERVYVAGMSAGAAAAAVLAAAYPDVYAALGVHSGLTCGLAHDVPSAFAAMRSDDLNGRERILERPRSEERRPIPTIVFHGDQDATVHPRNGDRFAEEMATANCVKQVEMGRVPGGRAYTRTTYTDASGQQLLEQWVIHGAGHAWSGGSASGSYTDPQGPDATKEFARFFLSHRH